MGHPLALLLRVSQRRHESTHLARDGVVARRGLEPAEGLGRLALESASGETRGFLDILGRLVRRPRVRGPLVHDARVAAICLAHGIDELLSRDRDFALFPELKTRNPFA